MADLRIVCLHGLGRGPARTRSGSSGWQRRAAPRRRRRLRRLTAL